MKKLQCASLVFSEVSVKNNFVKKQSMHSTLFSSPASTTYIMSGMVMLVSATFVAITHNLLPSGGG